MIGLHQGLSFGMFLLALMDILMLRVQGEVSWCMSFAYDIILIDETLGNNNTKPEVWRKTLKSKDSG